MFGDDIKMLLFQRWLDLLKSKVHGSKRATLMRLTFLRFNEEPKGPSEVRRNSV